MYNTFLQQSFTFTSYDAEFFEIKQYIYTLHTYYMLIVSKKFCFNSGLLRTIVSVLSVSGSESQYIFY